MFRIPICTSQLPFPSSLTWFGPTVVPDTIISLWIALSVPQRKIKVQIVIRNNVFSSMAELSCSVLGTGRHLRVSEVIEWMSDWKWTGNFQYFFVAHVFFEYLNIIKLSFSFESGIPRPMRTCDSRCGNTFAFATTTIKPRLSIISIAVLKNVSPTQSYRKEPPFPH
jgi:hypothetical protein